MSDVVLFPVGKEVSADAYLQWCNDTLSALDNAPRVWYGSDTVDAYGQRVVGYFGPTGYIRNNEPYPEPEDGPAMRADGALSSVLTYPPEEE